MSEKLIMELEQVANGLDCAGSSEAGVIEDYIADLKSGVPWEDVWDRMVKRYSPDNDDFLDQIRPFLPTP